VGLVTKYVHDLVAKQVEDRALVVRYDPARVYVTSAAARGSGGRDLHTLPADCTIVQRWRTTS